MENNRLDDFGSRLATDECEGCSIQGNHRACHSPQRPAGNHLATTEAPPSCHKCGRGDDPHSNPNRGDAKRKAPARNGCHGNNARISRWFLASLFLATLILTSLPPSARASNLQAKPNLYDITIDTHVTAKLPGNQIARDPLMSRIVKKRSSAKRRSPTKVIRRKHKKQNKRKKGRKRTRVDESLCQGNRTAQGWKTPQGVNRLYNHMGQSYNLAVYKDGTVAGERSGCRSDFSELKII